MRVVIRLDEPFWARSERRPKVNRKAIATRQERIRDLMLLALETPAGRALFNHSDLTATVRQHPRPEDLMDRFPVVERHAYFFDRNQFLNPESGEPGFQLFDYPPNPLPRTAILMDGFVETEKVMCFPEGWNQDLGSFRPECLAGPVNMLRRMATSVFNRGASFPSLRRPIVAFTGLPFGDHGVLTPADRGNFRRAFSQPVYEYFLGARNEVLARECPQHHGLHLHSAQAVVEILDPRTSELVITSLDNSLFPVVRLATGLSGTLDQTHCPCGFQGQRLINIQALATLHAQPRVRAAVVGAVPTEIYEGEPTLSDALPQEQTINQPST